MKRLFASVLLIVLVLSMLFMTACDIINNTTKTTLSAPTNLRVDENTATLMWNAVDHAVGYTILANETTYSSTTNSFSLLGLRDGSYTISVKADGDGILYGSSEYSISIQYTRNSNNDKEYQDNVLAAFREFDEINTKNSFLGYGIDIINASAITSKNVLMTYPIFDMDKLMNEQLLKSNEHYNTFETIEGATIQKFSENMSSSSSITAGTNVSAKGNIYGVNASASVSLSAGLTTAFTKTSDSVESQYFLQIVAENQSYWLILQTAEQRYKDILSEEFKADLYNTTITPAQLFEKYGTHLLTSVAMGGNICMYYTMYSYDKNTSDKEYSKVSSELKTNVEAAYGAYSGSASSNMSFENAFGYQSTAKNFGIQIDKKIVSAGGGSFGINNEATLYEHYYDWQKSLDSYPVVIGIKDTNSLYPIWNLLDLDVEGAVDRYNELYEYFCEYGEGSYNKLCETYAITPKVSPTDITNVNVGTIENYTEGEIVQVKAGDTMNISFDVLPANANRYIKTFASSNSESIEVDSTGAVFVKSNAVADTYVTVTIGAGTVSKQITFYIVNTFNVNFNTGFDDVTVAPIIGVKAGHMISEPQASKEGYKLIGWYKDLNWQEEFDFDVDRVTSHLTLYAKWQKIKPVVTFDTNGGSAIDSQTIAYNGNAVKPKNPSKSGYTFEGWFDDEELTELFDFSTNIISDRTLYAKWTKIEFTVDFVTNGGTPVASVTTSIEDGYRIVSPKTNKQYYTFDGWYKDENLTQIFYFDTEIVTNITLYAKWTATDTMVNFIDSDGVTPTYDALGMPITTRTTNVEKDFKITAPTPYKKGSSFLGWYLDGMPIDINSYEFKPNENEYILFARWEGEAVTEYTITFLDDDGSVIATVTKLYNDIVTAPEIPEREGYDSRWDQPVPERMPNENRTITVKRDIRSHWVTFYDFNGTLLAKYYLKYGSQINIPDVPNTEGYTFDGWNKEIPETVPDYDLEFKAVKTPIKSTITFELNKGNRIGTFSNVPMPEEAIYMTTTTLSTNMSSEGYIFDGWFLDANGSVKLAESNGKLLANVTNASVVYTNSNGEWVYSGSTNVKVYAGWVAREVKVTYNPNGGTCNETSDILTYDNLKLATPTRANYTFIGWFLDGGDVEISSVTQIINKGECTLVAKWVKTSYSVTLRSGGEDDDRTINEDDGFTEKITPYFHKNTLIAEGYTKLVITITIDIYPYWEGYQDVSVWRCNNSQLPVGLLYSHSYDTDKDSPYEEWTAHTIQLTLDLNDASDLGTICISYDAHGNGKDTWYLGTTTVSFVAVK